MVSAVQHINMLVINALYIGLARLIIKRQAIVPVSYTHLDVYKRQLQNSELLDVFSGGLSSVYSNSEEEAYKKLLDLLEENN